MNTVVLQNFVLKKNTTLKTTNQGFLKVCGDKTNKATLPKKKYFYQFMKLTQLYLGHIQCFYERVKCFSFC